MKYVRIYNTPPLVWIGKTRATKLALFFWRWL